MRKIMQHINYNLNEVTGYIGLCFQCSQDEHLSFTEREICGSVDHQIIPLFYSIKKVLNIFVKVNCALSF